MDSVAAHNERKERKMTARIYLLAAGADEINRIRAAKYPDPVIVEGRKYIARTEVKTIKGAQASKILAAMPWRG